MQDLSEKNPGILLQNDVHHTETKVCPHTDDEGHLFLSTAQVRRAKKALCGNPDCTCSGSLGIHGPQQHDFKSRGFDERERESFWVFGL